MGTKYQRPASTYAGASAVANRTKYQADSAAVPKVKISASKVDGDVNYVVDALNELDDAILGLAAGSIPDGSLTTAKYQDASVTNAKLASGVARTKLASGTANTLVGNDNTGAIADVTAGTGLTVSSNVLNIATGGISTNMLANGGVTTTKLTSGAATATQALFSDGSTGVAYRAIAATDLPAATTAAIGAVELATNAEVTTATDTGRVAPVSAMVAHPGMAKAWVVFTPSATSPTILASYNVSSVTANGAVAWDQTINFTTAFSSANYVMIGTGENPVAANECEVSVRPGGRAAGSCRINTRYNGAGAGLTSVMCVFYGAQA